MALGGFAFLTKVCRRRESKESIWERYESTMKYLVNYHTQKTAMPERKYIESDTRSQAVTKLLDEIPEAIISEMYEMQPRREVDSRNSDGLTCRPKITMTQRGPGRE